MTCRRPTISVRMEVLERLAQANSDPDAPDSLEFTPASWRTLDRDSLSEGLTELLAAQEERVRKEEEEQLEALRRKAEARAQKHAEALRWEKSLIERKRAERLDLRIEMARVRAAAEAAESFVSHQEVLRSALKSRAGELALEEEVAKAEVMHSRKRWAKTSQAFLAAAALVGVVWASAFGHLRSSEEAELAQVWRDSKAQELAAEARVVELEADFERHATLSESERASLKEELDRARASLDATKKEREEVDRRRPVEGPSKMAQKLTPIVNSKKTDLVSGQNDAPSPVSERVATDVVKEACSAFDPLCFDL